MRLIIATKNKGKLREIKKILQGVGIPIISLNQLDRKFNIKENGKTFRANAVKKAIAVSKVYPDDYVVGEDSGLEVQFLGGGPGVYSRRYSGKGSSDKKNNLKILRELQSVDRKNRRACFCCWASLFKNARLVKSFSGKLNGFISDKIRGTAGFGYDPVFYLPKYKKTAAQLPRNEKNKISHRAKAFSKLREYLTGQVEKQLTIP